jgi:hypothetical protein
MARFAEREPVLPRARRRARCSENKITTLYKIEIVDMYVHVYIFSLKARERSHQFAPNLACLYLETKKRF